MLKHIIIANNQFYQFYKPKKFWNNLALRMSNFQCMFYPLHVYSTLKSFWPFYVKDTSVLDCHFMQTVVLPDDRLVRREKCMYV
jgi:hypothetical protein